MKVSSGHLFVKMKCPGFVTEYFTPQIVNGRIVLQNYIQNRRSCKKNPNRQNPRNQQRRMKSALRVRSTLPNEDSTLKFSPPSENIPRMRGARRVRFTLPNADSIFRYSPPPEEIQIDLTDPEEHATKNIQSPEIEVSSTDSELGVREKNVKQ